MEPSPPSPPPEGLARFVRFGAVGVSGMLVDYGTFFGLRSLGCTGGLRLGPASVLFANMVSVAVAIQSNFLWNRRWTFADRRDASAARQWRLFTLFSTLTWVLNNLIVGLCEGAYGPGARMAVGGVGFPAVYVWKALAIAICTVANYGLSARVAFR